MSYTNATFYLDYESGSDTARADLVPTAYANNGAGLVRVTCNSTAAYSTGAVFDVAGTTGSVYVGGWLVTIIDGTHVDLQGSTFTVNPAAKGTMIPRGGSSKTDAWKTPTTGASAARTASGDTIRIKGSPDATSLAQNGTWTEAGPNNTTYAIVSSTNATPIVVTLSSANYALLSPAAGDTVIVNAHTTNTKGNGVWDIGAVDGTNKTISLINADGTNSVGNGVGGATGTVRKINNLRVKLTTAVTKAIALIGNQGTKTNWTSDGGANVVSSIITSDFKEGGECLQLAVGAGFVTGLAAHYATGTLDLSTYQQTTLWVKQTAGTVAIAGDASIRLCTDTIGTASVHTVAIPALAALNQWVPVTVDNAGALNSAIKSVALYIDTDRGAQTFLIDCIQACKASSSADSLTQTSLIGKNSASTEPWCGIQSINSTRVMLDGISTDRPAGSPQRGYSGTTETVTVYKRETIKTAMVATGPTVVAQVNTSGVILSGGWDRTNMTTQTLETFFDGQNGLGIGLALSISTSSKLHVYRYGTGYTGGLAFVMSGTFYAGNNGSIGAMLLTALQFMNSTLGDFVTFGNNGGITIQPGVNDVVGGYINSIRSIGDVGAGLFLNPSANRAISRCSFGDLTVLNNGFVGIQFTSNATYGVANCTFGTCVIKYCGSNGIATTIASFNTFKSITASNNMAPGISIGGTGNIVQAGSTTGNTTSGIVVPGAYPGANVFRNFTINEATPITGQTAVTSNRLNFENYGGVSNDHRTYAYEGNIVQQAATKHGSDNYGFKYSPLISTLNAAFPLDQIVLKFAVKANKAVTVSRWVQRDNTGLTLRVVCKGGQLNGVASDVVATASAAINTWEQLTLTPFTPTEAGVIKITEQAYGGTTFNGYTSDWTVTQAA